MKRTATASEQDGEVLQLAPDHHGPFRVGGVMHNDPEEAADAKGEDNGKGEEPGEGELLRLDVGADHAKDQGDEGDNA